MMLIFSSPSTIIANTIITTPVFVSSLIQDLYLDLCHLLLLKKIQIYKISKSI